ARLTVMDLAPYAVGLTRERFVLRGLRADFVVADAEYLPFAPGAFEMIFSSGVIHHTPRTETAAAEIVRTLRPGGQMTVMVYHRDSIWFWWNTVILLGLMMLVLNALPAALCNRALAARPAWRDYILPPGHRLRLDDVIRAGTDFGGLQNPLSRVYTRRSARALFPGLRDFRFVPTFQAYRSFDERPSAFTRFWRGVTDWANARWGWFLIVHGVRPPSPVGDVSEGKGEKGGEAE
ncbi:MAG: class I SAM-dependent methyltransferase, partial [Chloroflexi bacterium]|nr:class I SAM-dependent methyltransferase [Chloroflexota bacterium]